jgi:tight adherence protein C
MDSFTAALIALSNQLPALPDLIPMLSVTAFLAGGLALVTAGMRQNNESLSRRIASVQGISGIGREEGSAAKERQQSSIAGFADAEHRQVLRMFAAYNIAPESAPAYFTALRLAFAGIAGVPVLLFMPAPNPILTIVFALGAAMIAWFMPVVIVTRALKKHRKSVGVALPDTLELMAICVESGISLENAIFRVSREIKDTQPALAEELALTWAEISILPSRDQALENFSERVDIPTVRTVVGTLAQSLRYGSPLAQSLRAAASEMRAEQVTLLEERANRLPALMTIPVMLLIMPTIFLIVGGPAVIRMLDIFSGKQ